MSSTQRGLTAVPGKARGGNNQLMTMKKWIGSLGPGIIIAAVIFGPSKMTITSKMGAEYGYALLWVVVIAIFFLVIFTNMAARIGIATNQSLLTTIRNKWGNSVAIAVG